ncbi:MAG: ABC transporter permease subunit, partial [Planctomycetota bacterium]
MKPRFLPWLIVLIVLACGTAGLGFLLLAQNVTTGGRIVLALGQLLTYAWVIRGLFLWRHVGWVAKISRILIMTMIAGFLAGMSRTLGYDSAAIVFAGAWGMAIAFMLGLELLRLAFSPGWPVLGVARTLLDEAIRMKMALIFVVMLVLLVPVLPFMLGGETRLQYRLESFLTYSLTLISTLLAAMTILLAARTISSELTDRQAFLTLTKPISRAGYLAGKWIGIMGLNLLLLLVSGVGVVAFVKVIERTPAMDAADYIAVQEQVLTARVAIEPVPVDTAVMQLDFEKRLEDLRLRGADPLVYGNVGDPIAQVNPEQRKAI